MHPIDTILFSAASTIIANLVSKFIENKITLVKVSVAERQITQLAKKEADRLSLKSYDLISEAKRIWTFVISKMPEFEFSNNLSSKELKLLYNPNAEYSGINLLSNLKKRIMELENKQSSHQESSDLESLFLPTESEDKVVVTPVSSISISMLKNLQKRVNDKEELRI